MKTLIIALCMLFVLLPATAQQITAAGQPNFYVPYGVLDVPVEEAALESSSDALAIAEPPQRGAAPPAPHPYPMRRAHHSRYRPAYRGYPPTPPASTGAVIAGLVAVGLACLVLATGDH